MQDVRSFNYLSFFCLLKEDKQDDRETQVGFIQLANKTVCFLLEPVRKVKTSIG